MIHYTCDRCRALIDPVQQTRYVVRLQVQCITDGGNSQGADSDLDPLSELHHVLEGIDGQRLAEHDEADGEPIGGSPPDQLVEYDLCPRCYQRFARNPLGRDQQAVAHFSNN